jgi:hypothetical protein
VYISTAHSSLLWSRDRVSLDDWTILYANKHLYTNLPPSLELPTYSVHCDRGVHIVFGSQSVSETLLSVTTETSNNGERVIPWSIPSTKGLGIANPLQNFKIFQTNDDVHFESMSWTDSPSINLWSTKHEDHGWRFASIYFILWSQLVSPVCPTNDSVPRQNFFGWCKSTILSFICIYNSALVDDGDKVSFARCQPDANIWGILSSCSSYSEDIFWQQDKPHSAEGLLVWSSVDSLIIIIKS